MVNNNLENVIPWSTVRAAMKKKRKRIRKPSDPENMHSTVQSSEHRDRRSRLSQSSPVSVLKCPSPGQRLATAPCTSATEPGRTSALSHSWGSESIPIHGYSQPSNEMNFDLALPQMSKNQNPRPAKTITAPHRLARERLAENLAALIEIHFPMSRYGTRSAREMAVAKAAGSSWSTIQRILKREVSATTDTLVDLASVFGVSPSDLLTPNFSHTYVARIELQRRSG